LPPLGLTSFMDFMGMMSCEEHNRPICPTSLGLENAKEQHN